jgi:coenzyme Q-binding protein COQ10
MSRLRISRTLPYRPEQLFDIAADVESYPEFLPWWHSATVRQRNGDVYYTDQVVGFGPLTQSFSSKTVLRRPEEIEVTSIGGPFRTFQLIWRFASRSHDRCEVTLSGEIELRAPLLGRFLNRVTADGARSILSAFEIRARQLYASTRER